VPFREGFSGGGTRSYGLLFLINLPPRTHTITSPREASCDLILLNTPLATVTDVDRLGAVAVDDVAADVRVGATSNGDAVLPVAVHLVANEGATSVSAHVYPVTFIPHTQILQSHCPSILLY